VLVITPVVQTIIAAKKHATASSLAIMWHSANLQRDEMGLRELLLPQFGLSYPIPGVSSLNPFVSHYQKKYDFGLLNSRRSLMMKWSTRPRSLVLFPAYYQKDGTQTLTKLGWKQTQNVRFF
jgi:hypothetical protein